MARREKKEQPPEAVRRDGGLCVVFVNSASKKRKSISSYGELLAWGLRCGTVTGAEVERLERAAGERPEDAEAVFRRALELRACCARVLDGLTRREGPSGADLETLNAELSRARAAERLVRTGAGCRWVSGDLGGDDLDRVLWPVAASMAEVLTTKYHGKVRQCAGESCDLLFVDRTPGSPRRWCSMRACGARVKAKRDYYRRVKPEKERVKRRAQEILREHRRRRQETDDEPPGPRVA